MLFEFVPFNASPQIASFPITGIDEMLLAVALACEVPGFDPPIQ